MSARVVTLVGMVCLTMTVLVLYLAFAQVYAPAAAVAEAELRGEPPPVSVVPFVWPTEVSAFWWKFFLAAGLFATGTAACLIDLARRAVPSPTAR